MATEPESGQPSNEAVVHTPGPWSIDGVNVIAESWKGSRNANGCVCCTVSTDGRSPFEQIENARLIASAPDLLIALQECLAVISWDELTHGGAIGAGNAARDAIEKATGIRPAEVV